MSPSTISDSSLTQKPKLFPKIIRQRPSTRLIESNATRSNARKERKTTTTTTMAQRSIGRIIDVVAGLVRFVSIFSGEVGKRHHDISPSEIESSQTVLIGQMLIRLTLFAIWNPRDVAIYFLLQRRHQSMRIFKAVWPFVRQSYSQSVHTVYCSYA